ncbi:MAG TPA: hypothetical protein PKE49_05885 [Leptospiraceae bacterium]|jgi:hypothetical protein|nr:hypothetical protein [Leptospirales bacterium]HMU84493.1 hypothetical protein [Leptospiraceae bacterium]HMX56034.1 hypothetical protein [Leptospiraceae bacterium]HMY46494.1 hypothetical protein [Leptospiraceae bacterium]HMZ36513.1 hypothetical protein [Leptospiraceae bacterium]
MIPPFQDHPLVEEFNELKKYFRQHETEASRRRIKQFRSFARVIAEAGLPVGFDVMGSVNFGLATENSDVDLVLYVVCEDGYEGECPSPHCRTQQYVENLLIHTWIRGISDSPYPVQVVDCINLNLLKRDLEKGDPESSCLLRFAFYRSVCRGVNARLLRPYHKALLENQELVEKMKPYLWTLFDELVKSSKHNYSLMKYQDRLSQLGIGIPQSILGRIRGHLDQSRRHHGDGI